MSNTYHLYIIEQTLNLLRMSPQSISDWKEPIVEKRWLNKKSKIKPNWFGIIDINVPKSK